MRASKRPGFTLLELVVVMVIAGVFTALAIPRLDLSGYRADASVQGMRTILQQAQRTALEQQYDIYAIFDTATQSVIIAEDANNDGVIQPSEHIRRQTLYEQTTYMVPPTGLDSAVSLPITGSALRSMNAMPAIVYHRDGATSSDLDVYVGSAADPNTGYRAVRVSRATGRTTWFKYVPSRGWVEGGL